MKENALDDVLPIIGGIFPQQDIPHLTKPGASEVFGGGSSMESIIAYIENSVRE